MSECDCVEIFTSKLDEGANRAELIDGACPDCKCEPHRVSVHCGEPVDDRETLVRLVIDPIHIHHEEGSVRLRSTFFQSAGYDGASCLREDRAAREEHERTKALLLGSNPTEPDGTQRRVYGVVRMSVKKIREQTADIQIDKKTMQNIRAYCVYATGEADRPNHADIFVNGVTQLKISKAKRNRINEYLAKMFELIPAP